MEKTNEHCNQKKQSQAGSIIRADLMILLTVVTLLVFYFLKTGGNISGGANRLVASVDSLKSENTVLRQALSEKLISHCDTTPIDKKVKELKFDLKIK